MKISDIERSNIWMIVAKASVILGMFTTSFLGLFVDQTITIKIIQLSVNAYNSLWIMFSMACYLLLDLLLTDYSKYERRTWRLAHLSSIAYMIAGGLYLSTALVASSINGSMFLIISYICSAFLAGSVAFLGELKLIKKAQNVL